MVSALAAAVGAAAPAAEAACGGAQRFQPTKLRRPGAPPLAIGDSVMLGAAPQLRRRGFEIDVRGCRQMSEGLGLLSARRRAGTLPDVVVMALGTNWTVTTDQVRAALRILGPERVLGLVTPPEVGGVASSDQATIRAAGQRWKLRVKVLDWVAKSADRSWTWDGMHLKPEGAVAYARLLSQAFEWPIPSIEMTVARAATVEPPERLKA
jgi:hypothetical protein